MTPIDRPISSQDAAARPVRGSEQGRAVVWAEGGGGRELAALLRRRGLRPEEVMSAPAAVRAVLRRPAPSAVILVEPSRLTRATEAVGVFQDHAPAVRCWRFEGAPAGPGGAGLIEPIDGPLRLDRPLRLRQPPEEDSPRTPPPGAAGARLSRAELAMLLGPTRTLSTPAGDAG